MTKSEAIKAMEQGKKVTHRYFSDDEWVTIKDGRYVFEDGCRCNHYQFWELRTDKYWETDWDLFNNEQNVHGSVATEAK